MMLTDSSYDPHYSTIQHLNKILDLVNEGLQQEEMNKLDMDAIEAGIKGRVRKKEPLPDEAVEQPETKVIISCDASITENPDGQASTGVVVRFPREKPLILPKTCPASTTTNNQAEYDAIYEAFQHILGNLAAYLAKDLPVEIRSDSQLVVKQLNGEWGCNDETLEKKCTTISEIWNKLLDAKLNITVKWYPRNSTQDMKLANNAAQDQIGVKNH
jgi:ribonuclease HI